MNRFLPLYIAAITFSTLGCSSSEFDNRTTQELFNEMDSLDIAMNEMLSLSSTHPVAVQKNIVCISYPKMYKELYIPVTLEYVKRAGYDNYTKESLLANFKTVQNGYMASLNITC